MLGIAQEVLGVQRGGHRIYDRVHVYQRMTEYGLVEHQFYEALGIVYDRQRSYRARDYTEMLGQPLNARKRQTASA